MATTSPKTIQERAHVASSIRFLRQGLPRSAIDNDQARLVIAFYCLATLDLLGGVPDSISRNEQADWRRWLWEQQKSGPWGTGFRGSPYTNQRQPSKYDPPFLIMTYAAILSLAILRDPLDQLDKAGILRYLSVSQREDGSFKLYPSSEEYDLRMTYCAFAICAMLEDWSAIRIPNAVCFIESCRAYEGGYGQEPHNEAHGGSTYCALAALDLLPAEYRKGNTPSTGDETNGIRNGNEANGIKGNGILTPKQRAQTVRWLLYHQKSGFAGRTNKESDACYCFWCGASLAILGHANLANTTANADFLLQCQFKFGGIRKDPESPPDPYHTYLGLASLSILSRDDMDLSGFDILDASLNTTLQTRQWLRDHLHKTPLPQTK